MVTSTSQVSGLAVDLAGSTLLSVASGFFATTSLVHMVVYMVWLDGSIAWCLVGLAGALGWLWACVVGYFGVESWGLGVVQVSVLSRGSGASARSGVAVLWTCALACLVLDAGSWVSDCGAVLFVSSLVAMVACGSTVLPCSRASVASLRGCCVSGVGCVLVVLLCVLVPSLVLVYGIAVSAWLGVSGAIVGVGIAGVGLGLVSGALLSWMPLGVIGYTKITTWKMTPVR